MADLWKKSSRSSGNNGNCIELRSDLGALRDSKNPTGPALAVDLDEFLTAVRTGKFDR